jgi:hypothetical protein
VHEKPTLPAVLFSYRWAMKHAVLQSIAHNVADSLASGCGLLIGIYEMDVFGDAARSAGGVIEIDFLAGLCIEGEPSPDIVTAAARYRDALPGLCTRHGASAADFLALRVRFCSGAAGPSFVVTVEDSSGRRSVDHYVGQPGARPRIVDALGRIRTIR